MKVSIITVAYNSAQTIAQAMDSVLQQTYKDIEYIVVDGLSTDDTLSIVKQYEPKFQGRMRWLSEKDDGIYDAMNKGVHMATGNIVGCYLWRYSFCQARQSTEMHQILFWKNFPPMAIKIRLLPSPPFLIHPPRIIR